MKYIQSFYQYPVTFSSIGKTIPARNAKGDMRNIAEFTEKELERLQNCEPFFRELLNKKKIRVLNHIPASYIPASEQINKAHEEADRFKAENEILKAKLAELEGGKAPAEETISDGATTDDVDSTDPSPAEKSENSAEDIKSLSYDDLKARATELGLEFKANAKKADLIKMIEDAQTKAD